VGEQPGARLLDLVAVMDRLRSPGGCPWDAEQTHRSLAPYLLEETYETLEAIDSGDRDHLREELGDLLLQVVFHARVAAEDPEDPWTVDDVAAGITEKLVRRHPHVFADATAPSAAHVEAAWEQLKAAEKQRGSVLDGIPPALPALALADATVRRARRAGLPLPDGGRGRVQPLASEDVGRIASGSSDAAGGARGASEEVGPIASGSSDAAGGARGASEEVGPIASRSSDARAAGGALPAPPDERAVGTALLALVVEAEAHGVDAEQALRAVVRDYAREVRRAETQAGP
jgi:XTP/dITP diphosphohydrolase